MNETDEFNEERINKKKIATISIVIFLLVSVAGFTSYKVYSNIRKKEQARIVEEEAKKQLEAEKAEKERQLEENKKASKDEAKNEKEKVNIGEWENLHNMINTVIVSQDVWGKKEITKDEVARVKALFEGKDETITNYLSEWQNLDFSNSVDFHNYVWEKLGGTVGRATDTNSEAIDKAKLAMK